MALPTRPIARHAVVRRGTLVWDYPAPVDVMASGAEQISPNQNAIASVEQFSLIGKAGADDPDSYLQRNWQALITP